MSDLRQVPQDTYVASVTSTDIAPSRDKLRRPSNNYMVKYGFKLASTLAKFILAAVAISLWG